MSEQSTEILSLWIIPSNRFTESFYCQRVLLQLKLTFGENPKQGTGSGREWTEKINIDAWIRFEEQNVHLNRADLHNHFFNIGQ